ncbi:MAG: TRAP transporter substrate-binding protein [Oscillospiraceae bacterium]|nr:TRAP transporter substrate-binding protein [Oscillospiraceae bacterium]
MKRLHVVLLAALCVLLLAGCGAKDEEAVPDVIFRYADNQPEGYPTTVAAEYFAQLVEERTDGKVCIRVFSDGVLGDEVSVFEQMQFGGVDMGRISTGTLAQFVPEAEILQLPYLFQDSAHMWRVLDGEIGDELLGDIQSAGAVGLSWFDAGARNFYTTSPVHTLEDLSGMRIRVQESTFMSRMIRLWGATPMQIPYGGVYSALQTDQIDGAENNWPSYESSGHFEAAPYYLLDGHSRLPEVQVISSIALDKLAALDEGYVDILRQCAQECAVYERELWQARETESEELVRGYGCVVTRLSAAEREKFRQAIQPMYDSYSEETRALIERIRES